ncbi:hypothetical protein QR680_004269 [Steinernema hermaphroditum]|uniref:Uncharacterized protein n=1 Tax=Steinernema hermaphroditum TaxID=289476 RepID=A0AA39LTE1_9BILA|nr:hypothetical protein QR680_004269 [Steinernema hermaphroditum]
MELPVEGPILVLAAIAAVIFSLIFVLTCCYCICGCCGGSAKNRKFVLDHENDVSEQEYRKEIQRLLDRYRAMERRKMNPDEPDYTLHDTYTTAETRAATPVKSRAKTLADQAAQLKKELTQYKVEHNVEIKREEHNPNRRRTWGGLQEESEVEPVELPNQMNMGVQTTSTLERRRLDPAVVAAAHKNVETTV